MDKKLLLKSIVKCVVVWTIIASIVFTLAFLMSSTGGIIVLCVIAFALCVCAIYGELDKV